MIGLYYPFIHFRNENWLKLALIYWSKIARIVPHDYETRDSEEVRRAKGESNAIISAPPDLAGNEVTRNFVAFVKSHSEQLREGYDVTNSEEWPILRDTEANAPNGTDPHFAYIYKEKLGDDLVCALTRERLGVWGEGRGASRDMRWIGVHPKLANVFMTSMAEGIAKHTGYGLLADDLTQHLVVGEHSVDRLAELLLHRRFDINPQDLISEEALAITAIRIVLPRDLSSVPMAKIIAFRKQFPAELEEFQKWIHGEVKRLKEETKGITSPSAMNNYMTELEEQKIKPRLKELKKQLRYAGIECATTSVAVKLAAAFAGHGIANWLNQPALQTAGYAVSFLPIATKSAREAHKLVASNPTAYLMHAQERLTPRTLMQRLDRTFRKVTTGI